jgi:F0F1-type ATP synthase delta subunit
MTKIPKKYAEALFDAAGALGCGLVVADELPAVCGLLQRFGIFFNNPMIVDAKKCDMLKSVLAGKANPLTIEFVLLLIVRRHLKYLGDAADIFVRMCDTLRGFFTLRIQAAYKPDPDMLGRISAKLVKIGLIPGKFSKNIRFSVEIEPELVGGFVAYGDGVRVDASLKTAFSRIRAR